MASTSVDEGIFYIARGNPADKNQNNSIALSSSLHSSSNFQSFRQCSSNKNGFTFIDGFKGKLVVACPNKALMQVYSYGKESPEQRIPIPEELTCLTSCNHPNTNRPWLLAGGSKSGKLYIWEISSGLLLQVKEIHYQAVTTINFTQNGEFIVSGSLDSRVVVWKTFDLISFQDDSKTLKPYATFTDHALPITDIIITKGVINDIKIYSCSQDCTVRSYHLSTRTLLTTFVAPSPVQSIALDSAERSVFFGMSDGLIRLVPLYVVDSQTRLLEKVGGNSKVITLSNDPNLTSTFIHHQGSSVTSLELSLDGTYICSGDDKGRVFTSDVITKQNLKKFKELPFEITGIFCFTQNSKEVSSNFTLPVLKRVLAGEQDLIRHEIYKNSKPTTNPLSFDLKEFIDSTKEEELTFLNLSDVNSTVTTTSTTTTSQNSSREDKQKIADLEEKLLVLTKGYSDLRQIHEELYAEHAKLVGN